MTRNVIQKTLLCAILIGLPVLSCHASNKVFKWTDVEGRTHYGDSAPESVQAENLQINPRRPWRRVTVKSVTDGDTFRLTTGEKVRLLNINAPELAIRGRPGQALASEAREKLSSLIDGQTIRVKAGEQRQDTYGRQLVYAQTMAGDDIAGMMLAAGMGYLDVREPNSADWQRYAALERSARDSALGIWTLEDFAIHPVSSTGNRQNLFTRLREPVQSIRLIGKDWHLSLGEGLSLITTNDNPEIVTWVKALRVGSIVSVRGKIRSRKQRPVIYLRHLSQIEQ